MNFLNLPKKSLGQNFLIDKNIIRKISNIIEIKKNTKILEIGPGYGNLTEEIIKKKPEFLYAVEKDKKLAILLKENYQKSRNLKIINDDIFNFLKIKSSEDNFIVFGNLPYNISTKILSTLILIKKWPPWYNNLIFMFQKEVADRILAKNNSKKFGRLSVLCNWRLEIKKHFDISKNCFYPKPKVNSTLLSFKPKNDNKYIINNPKNLEFVTRILFSNRRKMIKKNIYKLFSNNENAIKDLRLNLECRPGELSSEAYYKITLKYEKLNL